MAARTVLLAGATGVVGTQLLPLLNGAGHRVRTLSRSPERAARLRDQVWDVAVADATRGGLDGVMREVDVVVSCLGANVGPGLAERRSYRAVDGVANRNLLAAARAAGVKRYVYLSLHVEPGYAGTRYVRAHEDFVAELRDSGLTSTVVRPTGIFPALAPFVDMARKGRLAVFGDGATRSNPVSAEDVAEATFAALDEGPPDFAVGGPDVLSRREIAELARAAAGGKAKIRSVPAWLPRLAGAMLRPFHPRLSDLIQFVVAVSTHECVAPRVGKRRLEDFFTGLR